MTKRMLIDATHKEETRVVTISNGKIYDYDSETSTKKQLKGNIYLAKVARVEPSLQAVFVEYGGSRHGFLPFSEIHPDYYRIPVEDLKEPEESTEEAKIADTEAPATDDSETNDPESEDVFDEVPKQNRRGLDKYKIQEVIQKRQILLIQIVKEERGNKGAALTTYLSIPGRYCVLMPNTPDSGGISRKISHPQSRSKLKKIIDSITLPEGVSIIIRTAGMERTKTEIKRDFEYLMRLWEKIRQLTLESIAPSLIYQEDDLIKRSIRDIYTRDIIDIIIEGEEAYKSAKNLMKLLMPSHAKRVQKYKDEQVSLYQKHDVENKLIEIYQPSVELRSGGTIVINPTEALVSVDVNSARSTKQRHIDDTALTTNLEAAEEVARQLKLRDLGGLVVIDFIDMQEEKHNFYVEKKLRDCLRGDRARIQIGKISNFGLLEMSRQRMRPSLLEVSTQTCPTCRGIGLIRSTESASLTVLRAIEGEAIQNTGKQIVANVSHDVAQFMLNQKRKYIHQIEEKFDVLVYIRSESTLFSEQYAIAIIDKNDMPLANTNIKLQQSNKTHDSKSQKNNKNIAGKKQKQNPQHKTNKPASQKDNKYHNKNTQNQKTNSDADTANATSVMNSGQDSDSQTSQNQTPSPKKQRRRPNKNKKGYTPHQKSFDNNNTINRQEKNNVDGNIKNIAPVKSDLENNGNIIPNDEQSEANGNIVRKNNILKNRNRSKSRQQNSKTAPQAPINQKTENSEQKDIQTDNSKQKNTKTNENAKNEPEKIKVDKRKTVKKNDSEQSAQTAASISQLPKAANDSAIKKKKKKENIEPRPDKKKQGWWQRLLES